MFRWKFPLFEMSCRCIEPSSCFSYSFSFHSASKQKHTKQWQKKTDIEGKRIKPSNTNTFTHSQATRKSIGKCLCSTKKKQQQQLREIYNNIVSVTFDVTDDKQKFCFSLKQPKKDNKYVVIHNRTYTYAYTNTK